MKAKGKATAPQFATPFTWGEPMHVPKSAWLGHIPFARWIVENLNPKCIVELGTHTGASFFAFCQAVHELDFACEVHAIDTWEGDEHSGLYGTEIFESVESILKSKYPGIGKLHRMKFDDARCRFTEESIDILHIDGLHTHDAVTHDFRTWKKAVKSGGVILFHDTAETADGFGVWKLWDEIKHSYPSFEFHHSHGLGVIGIGGQFPERLTKFFRSSEDVGSVEEIRRQFSIPGQRLEMLPGHLELQDQIRTLNREIDSMKTSKSWKITRPLRVLESKLSKRNNL